MVFGTDPTVVDGQIQIWREFVQTAPERAVCITLEIDGFSFWWNDDHCATMDSNVVSGGSVPDTVHQIGVRCCVEWTLDHLLLLAHNQRGQSEGQEELVSRHDDCLERGCWLTAYRPLEAALPICIPPN